ncbi:hypothetical protein GHT06_019791 [Daphnia sinensis]|uniref:Uncharacterized protein n=1 Tax=Daphnia sinensis TaxID=1820382 RepID=A0AAD5PQX6_9CRUS|nr:hypothetical protein GHT06_019791 [Daphnia sinensis]
MEYLGVCQPMGTKRRRTAAGVPQSNKPGRAGHGSQFLFPSYPRSVLALLPPVTDERRAAAANGQGREEAEFQLTCLNFIGPDGSDEPAESTSQRFRLAHFPFYPSAMPDESLYDEGCNGLPLSEMITDRQEYSADTFRSSPARDLAAKPRLSHIKSESLTQFR